MAAMQQVLITPELFDMILFSVSSKDTLRLRRVHPQLRAYVDRSTRIQQDKLFLTPARAGAAWHTRAWNPYKELQVEEQSTEIVFAQRQFARPGMLTPALMNALLARLSSQ